MSLQRLDNKAARRLFLDRHALIEPPTGNAKGADLLALINRLGFVQVDSINTVERAYQTILGCRGRSYRPDHLRPLLEQSRCLFEHWTHDASIIPSAFLPQWQLRFARDGERIRSRWTDWHGPAFKEKIDDVLEHVRASGPVGSGDVGTDETRSKGGWWEWHPSKTALEYLWRSGVLSVCERRGFAKIYDLTERVYPHASTLAEPDPAETIDWACNGALDRLGFATSGEIAAFFDLITPLEAKEWCARALAQASIEEVEIEGADGRWHKVFARPDTRQHADDLSPPPNRLSILSPFDPALRDRKRSERLFGFHYRIEVFVPEAQRRYGYYVFPVMEGDRLIGRIDVKCQRAEGQLGITAFWPEAGVALGQGRLARLEAELVRLGRFTGCNRLSFANGWLRETLGT